MKTSELTGAALDWAVAKCEGHKGLWIEDDLHGNHIRRPYTPSTDWAQGGPIIERWEIEITMTGIHTWKAKTISIGRLYSANGSTPLIAAMRCYVASKLGDKIDLPEKLK